MVVKVVGIVVNFVGSVAIVGMKVPVIFGRGIVSWYCKI